MNMKKFSALLLALSMVLSLAACGGKQIPPRDGIPSPHLGTIRDMRTFPQDLTVFARQAGADTPLLDSQAQAEQDARFNRIFFGPWDMHKTSIRKREVEIYFRKARGYKYGDVRWTQDEWDAMRANARLKGFPNAAMHGITVRNADLREMPSHTPRFSEPTPDPRTNPFDYFQYSLLPVGTPVFIAHTSRDGHWYYVGTPVAAGWVDASDVGLVDDAFEAERQFASDASHELRTPMAVIMAQCEDALSGEKTGADYREALSVIHRQGRRMNRMISGMLELVRMERKTDRYAREPFNLSALTESVCEDMALICEKNIALTTDVEPDISITGDQTLITRLLGNLIGNAYRYGRENGHIIVTLHRAGSAIELTVSDDGIGIAPDQQKKIFRRLYQGASERSGDGAGLGLAMARQIARLHGGELTVVSEEGKGSAFTARFPMQ